MWNFISTGQNSLVNTAATLTLGYGSNQTGTPFLLLQNVASGTTVNLPKINQVPPTAPSVPGTTPAVGDGYVLIIKNLQQQQTTITPASGDTCDVALLSNIGDSVFLVTDAANSVWRLIQPSSTVNQITTTSAAAFTLAATTRYLVASTAATITLPASLRVAQPYTIMNESTGSLTLTPASGTIDTTASFTLTTLKSFTAISDGTNFHAINTQ